MAVASANILFPSPEQKRKIRNNLSFETEWTSDRLEENKFINRVRGRVDTWRKGGYQGITKTTARLLEYWNNPERERKLFFCQIEALETAIYITEVANKHGDAWIGMLSGAQTRKPIPCSSGLRSRWQLAPGRPWLWLC